MPTRPTQTFKYTYKYYPDIAEKTFQEESCYIYRFFLPFGRTDIAGWNEYAIKRGGKRNKIQPRFFFKRKVSYVKPLIFLPSRLLRAFWAAFCSASFMELPVALARELFSKKTSTVNCFLWSGPVVVIIL